MFLSTASCSACVVHRTRCSSALCRYVQHVTLPHLHTAPGTHAHMYTPPCYTMWKYRTCLASLRSLCVAVCTACVANTCTAIRPCIVIALCAPFHVPLVNGTDKIVINAQQVCCTILWLCAHVCSCAAAWPACTVAPCGPPVQ